VGAGRVTGKDWQSWLFETHTHWFDSYYLSGPCCPNFALVKYHCWRPDFACLTLLVMDFAVVRNGARS
jgi:hypothetical protein